MVRDPSPDKLPVFIIIDHAGAMWRHVNAIERNTHALIRQLERDALWPRIGLTLCGIGSLTRTIDPDRLDSRKHGYLSHVLPRPNLASGLGRVLKSVTGRRTDYVVKGLVFVIIGNQPMKERWTGYARDLEKLGLEIYPVAISSSRGNLPEEFLKELRTGNVQPLQVNLDGQASELEYIFSQWMPAIILKALETARKPVLKGRPKPAPRARPAQAKPGPKAKHVPSTVKAPPPKPYVADSQGVAKIWRVLPPDDPSDPVDHEMVDSVETPTGWRLIGASRRGKMHAHTARYREDAFTLGKAQGWHFVVVADGGGSCPLSRVGSQLAADTAVETMEQLIRSTSHGDMTPANYCKHILVKGMQAAWQALEREAQKRQIPFKDLGTTFLAVAHKPSAQEDLIAVLQIGDGLVAAELEGDRVVPLAEPDVGQSASQTLFLTSRHWQDWQDRVQVHPLTQPIRTLAVMCDGVADDFIPHDKLVPELFAKLKPVLSQQQQPEQALLKLLDYKQRGSFDDRTLALIYRAPVGHGT